MTCDLSAQMPLSLGEELEVGVVPPSAMSPPEDEGVATMR